MEANAGPTQVAELAPHRAEGWHAWLRQLEVAIGYVDLLIALVAFSLAAFCLVAPFLPDPEKRDNVELIWFAVPVLLLFGFAALMASRDMRAHARWRWLSQVLPTMGVVAAYILFH